MELQVNVEQQNKEISAFLHQLLADPIQKVSSDINPSQSLKGIVVGKTNDVTVDEFDDNITLFQEDALVKDAFEKGVDLRRYAHDIEEELEKEEKQHVLDYVANTSVLVDLFSQIETCDEILENMEKLLGTFQKSVGKLSGEIQSLQDQSNIMNTKLRNRKIARNELEVLIENSIITPENIKLLVEGDVNEAYIEGIKDFNKKTMFFKANKAKKLAVLKDTTPYMELLRLRATWKIRNFFIEKFAYLRQPSSNIQVMQQMLLKHKALYWFVREFHSEAASEIRQNYIYMARTFILNHFDIYCKLLSKFQTIVVDKLDLLGYEENVKKGFFGSGKQAIKNKGNVFSLGDRLSVLTSTDHSVILPHIAEEKNERYPFEVLFRSYNRLLVDTATTEFLFIEDFFYGKDMFSRRNSKTTVQHLFNSIFEPSMNLAISLTKQYLESSYDAMGALLAVRANMQHILLLQQRRVPAMEKYFNAMNMLLWPRFQSIMDLHIESLKKAVTGKLMPSKDSRPHYVIRRYAEFSASILSLNEGFDDQILVNSLLRLRTEAETLLLRLSTEFTDPKEKLIFILNNYDMLVTVHEEAPHATAEKEKIFFSRRLNDYIMEYVEEELKPYLGDMMELVKRAETERVVQSIPADQFEKVSENFSLHWRQHITSMNSSVMQTFTNFKMGSMILHSVLGQLIVYYTRFQALMDERFAHKPDFKHSPVGTQLLMVEIKKYKSNF